MSWRLEITHRTGFEYEGEVLGSYNLARLTPRSTGGQLVLESSVAVEPPAKLHQSVDYWGTIVHSFDLHVPHRRLDIVGHSVVETGAARHAPTGIAWDVLEEERLVDRMTEYLTPSPMTTPDEHVLALASELRSGRDPVETVHAVVRWVRDNVGYERGITSVETAATGVLAARRGVCQDFAHLTIALLRAAHVPARYVSGYLHPERDTAVGETCAGESHAWVEAWLGAWWPIDPTNGEPVGERHVRVAQGRDYRDVPPLTGIFHGAPSKALHVHVELTRIA